MYLVSDSSVRRLIAYDCSAQNTRMHGSTKKTYSVPRGGLRAMLLVGVALLLTCPAPTQAQDHAEVGFFAQYLRFNNTYAGGIGGRLSIIVSPRVLLDVEGAHDFKSKTFNAQFLTPIGSVVTQNMSTDGYEFLVGPKFQFGTRIALFASLRAGAFHFNSYLPDVSLGVPNNVFPGTPLNGFVPSGTSAALYPSVGFEVGRDRSGLRVDIGDLILFSSTTRNNFKLSAGPVFRF